jgi:hypothetical protein
MQWCSEVLRLRPVHSPRCKTDFIIVNCNNNTHTCTRTGAGPNPYGRVCGQCRSSALAVLLGFNTGAALIPHRPCTLHERRHPAVCECCRSSIHTHRHTRTRARARALTHTHTHTHTRSCEPSGLCTPAVRSITGFSHCTRMFLALAEPVLSHLWGRGLALTCWGARMAPSRRPCKFGKTTLSGTLGGCGAAWPPPSSALRVACHCWRVHGCARACGNGTD